MENKNYYIRIVPTPIGWDIILSRDLRDYVINMPDYGEVNLMSDIISDCLYDYWTKFVPDQIGDDYDG